jgi:hypothetical protein
MLLGNYNDASGHTHSFLGAWDWTSWTSVDKPESAWTAAFGIDGENIVGYYGDVPGEAGAHGFLYDGTTWTILDMPGVGVSLTIPSGISGSKIVGSYHDASGWHGFLYDMSTAHWTTIDAFGVPGAELMDIDGSNIVGCDYAGGHGVFYNGTSWTYLDMPGAHATFASGIDGNNIVGGYIDPASGHYRGFLYVIPEPGALSLLTLGGLALLRRHRA